MKWHENTYLEFEPIGRTDDFKTFTTLLELEVAVQARPELDEALNRAVEALQAAATMRRAGISVTRIKPHLYRVAVCERTPCGTTTQHWSPSQEQPRAAP
jgi:hypothetical protein